MIEVYYLRKFRLINGSFFVRKTNTRWCLKKGWVISSISDER